MQKIAYNLKEEFHKHRNIVFVVFVFCMTAVWSFFSMANIQNSSAANLNNFNAANIISDAVMSNYTSMSVSEIQSFLDSKNRCDNRDYNLYLQYTSSHPNITWHWEGEPYNGHFVCLAQERFGDGEVIGSGMTAAEIIADAAKQYKINPQVLLVLLQKESSLITDKVPNSHDYRQATGYGCPDTAACNSKYYGFKNQVYRAAELFRYVLDNNSSYYPAGREVYVGYHPSASCGGTRLRIENRATAALYQYTPYQPNAAALNAGYGTGDNCSAYGNRNFYLYFTDWFGSTQAAVDGELVIIPDGEYNLSAATGAGRALGTSGANAQLVALDTEDKTQRWKLQRESSTGYYQITNVATNQPLIAQNVEVEQGNNALIGASTTCSKWWKIYQTNDNYLTFESSCVPGMVLDIYGGSANIGTNVQLWLTHGGASQKWKIWTGRTLEDGIYTITTSINDAKVADINGGSRSNGANIQIYSDNRTLAQKWEIKYDKTNDSYTFTNPVSNKVLEADGKTNNGTNVQIYEANKSCYQEWKISPVTDEYYAIISTCSLSKVLDLSNAQINNGSNIQLWSYDPNTAAQKWYFQDAPDIIDGTYSIVSALPSGNQLKVVDLSNANISNGTNIQLWSYDGNTPAQKWDITKDVTSGLYTIINPETNKSLDIFAASIKNSTNIHQYELHNGCTQKWRIIESSEDVYSILSSCNTEFAIDVSGGGIANGTNIQLWSYDANAFAQKWYFIERE